MATTAAIKQYNDLKDRVGDSVLLFRMGDFYEMFDGDAVICSKVLGITLTTMQTQDGKPTPLAGIPCHSLDKYRKKLVAAGYTVAVSDFLP